MGDDRGLDSCVLTNTDSSCCAVGLSGLGATLRHVMIDEVGVVGLRPYRCC